MQETGGNHPIEDTLPKHLLPTLSLVRLNLPPLTSLHFSRQRLKAPAISSNRMRNSFRNLDPNSHIRICENITIGLIVQAVDLSSCCTIHSAAAAPALARAH
jgi:hypothetical protein